MKNTLWLMLTLVLPESLYAQNSVQENSPIMKIADGFYHLFYDSSSAKSTIIEFDKYVALLEVPISNEGGGATNLKDHEFGARKVISTIAKYFPKKPLKYVLHSHWHPHSISSVKPFLAAGATIVSTRTNFERMRDFVDDATIHKYKKQIQFVDGDSLLIKDKTNSIIAYRFLQADYPSTPAAEYLYFYFPKYMALHSGCMYAKWTGQPVDGRNVITDRQRDLNAFIAKKKLKVDNFVRLNGDRNAPKCLMNGDEFRDVINTGITSAEINETYFAVETALLNQKQDSIAQLILSRKIPVSLLNGNVYSSLRQRNIERALAFAKLQVLISPGDANAWDTLGEVNFFSGQTELAERYRQLCLKTDPAFSGGGPAVWTKNLAEHKLIWNDSSPD